MLKNTMNDSQRQQFQNNKKKDNLIKIYRQSKYIDKSKSRLNNLYQTNWLFQMNNLIFKLGLNDSKRIKFAKTSSVEDLRKIIQSIFGLTDRIIGITDENGKFFDLEFVNQNTVMFKSHVLSLVLAKDSNQENMSFASDHIQFFPIKKEPEHMTQPNNNQELFHQPNGLLGYINDLTAFEELLLEENKPAIVIETKKENSSKISIPYNFYIKQWEKGSDNTGRVILYFDRSKIGEFYLKGWANLQVMIEGLMKNLINQDNQDNHDQHQLHFKQKNSEELRPNTSHANMKKNKKVQRQIQVQDSSDQQQIDPRGQQNQIQAQQIKNTFLDNLAKLRDEETISQLEFYKLKSKLLENPQEFMRKYQMGTRQGFRKQKSIDELRDQIIRSKEEKSRYQTIINEFREIQNPQSRQDNFRRSYKNQIPIIVRKYNNVIQKISTSYPLTLQQEQAINLIMQLELKGLISESDSRDYKAHILQENQEIFELFDLYFEQRIDQIELARRLKNKNKTDRKNLEEKNKKEEIVRGIIKYAKRNSFELLRNLALEGNAYIIKCFERYEQDKNQQNLAISLEKVANYYRSKSSLENRLHIADL